MTFSQGQGPSEGVLVTGSTGFVGQHVCRNWGNVVPWPAKDLRQDEVVLKTVDELLEERPFDSVLHLAAAASPKASFESLSETYAVNTMGTVHLLNGLQRSGWSGKFLLISSGAVYGSPDLLQQPITEEYQAAPDSPYAASKYAAEVAALEIGRRSSIEVVVARPFNHSGSGQSIEYFLPAMASQICAVCRGDEATIEVGNLSAYRDFLHVQDVVAAYSALLKSGKPGRVYNVASGHSRRLDEILTELASASGRRINFKICQERFRDEISQPLRVSIDRIRQDTGWMPRTPLEHLWRDLIESWDTTHA